MFKRQAKKEKKERKSKIHPLHEKAKVLEKNSIDLQSESSSSSSSPPPNPKNLDKHQAQEDVDNLRKAVTAHRISLGKAHKGGDIELANKAFANIEKAASDLPLMLALEAYLPEPSSNRLDAQRKDLQSQISALQAQQRALPKQQKQPASSASSSSSSSKPKAPQKKRLSTPSALPEVRAPNHNPYAKTTTSKRVRKPSPVPVPVSKFISI